MFRFVSRTAVFGMLFWAFVCLWPAVDNKLRIPIVPDTYSDNNPDSVPTFIRTKNRVEGGIWMTISNRSVLLIA